jgi:glucose/arabinose dehydrogenase
MLRQALSVLCVTAFLLAFAAPPAVAQSPLTPAPRLQRVVTGLDRPTHVTHAADGSDRLFITEKPGTIRVLQNDILLPVPFLDISDRVLSSGSEQGLFSVAFPPAGADAGHVYVNYTGLPDGETVVSRFAISPDDANAADAASEERILIIEQPFANHNGGQLTFGPDGYLYIGTGDGGSGGDPQGNAQNGSALLGKILRIDVESAPAGEPYGIPATNPFVDTAGFRPEVWALGLRNPWRFSFDRATGDLYIADVGQSTREEVNYQPSGGGGENYGWNIMEGSTCFQAQSCVTEGLTLPVAEYGRDLGTSITGGHVYRATAPAAWGGIYFYGDFGSGRIWALERLNDGWRNTLVLDTELSIASFGEDEAGHLYVVDLGGSVYALATATYLPIFGAWTRIDMPSSSAILMYAAH